MVDLYGFAPGSVVELPISGKPAAFTVAGVWRDYARPQGAVVIERERYIALTGDRNASGGALWLAAGANSEAVSQSIAHDIPGGARLEIAAPGEIRELSLQAFDRTFAVTYALEAAAVLIGLVGLSATLVAQTLARSREFGMLRHIGMTRRQLQGMLGVEGAALAVIGTVAGMVLGFVISLILVHVVNRQSFHWGMDLHVPWGALVVLAMTLIALATLTARASARSATSMSAVRAVREDW